MKYHKKFPYSREQYEHKLSLLPKLKKDLDELHKPFTGGKKFDSVTKQKVEQLIHAIKGVKYYLKFYRAWYYE